jgi:hypothetical protein
LRENIDPLPPFSSHYYGLINDSPKTLEEAFEPTDAAALADAVQRLGFENVASGDLVTILETKGNRRRTSLR